MCSIRIYQNMIVLGLSRDVRAPRVKHKFWSVTGLNHSRSTYLNTRFSAFTATNYIFGILKAICETNELSLLAIVTLSDLNVTHFRN